MVDQRAALQRLIEERREDYAGLSRLIGRNAAYIQQFIKRGTPKRLDADDVHTLARYFGVDEAELGARKPGARTGEGTLIRVSRLDVRASAGPGSLATGEQLISHLTFDDLWLRRLTRTPAAQLNFIRVEGDSMAPTLADGDEILVDRGDAAERLRDGIYVLRREDDLLVKRLALSPVPRRATIRSDNAAYPDWPDCDLAALEVIGRVIWAGRRIG